MPTRLPAVACACKVTAAASRANHDAMPLPTASGRPAVQQHPVRRQARRLLLGLLALATAKAAWDSQSALCTWRRGSSNQISKNAEPVAAGQQGTVPAAHTASSADEATVLGGAASGPAAPPSSNVSQTAAAAAHTARPAASFAWEERPGGPYPPAELPPPTVDAASNHSCAQVGRRSVRLGRWMHSEHAARCSGCLLQCMQHSL